MRNVRKKFKEKRFSFLSTGMEQKLTVLTLIALFILNLCKGQSIDTIKHDFISTDSTGMAKMQKTENVHFFSFYLVNSVDSTKKVKVINVSPYFIGFNDFLCDTTKIYSKHKANGYISAIDDTSVIFKTYYESINEKYKTGYYSTISNTYQGNPSDNYRGLEKTINICDIEYLNYKSPEKQMLTELGWSIVFMSVLAIAASPFISHNFITGDYYPKRFKSIVTGTTIGISIGIPLCVIGGKHKNYRLTTKNLKQDKDHWYLQSE